MSTSNQGQCGRNALLLGALFAGACGSEGGVTIETADGVRGVHMAEVSSDFTKLYLTSAETNEVVVVDARLLGDETSSEALANRAYVVSRDSRELTVIDLRTLELVTSTGDYDVLRRVRVGEHPTHVSTSRDGSLLAVMDEEEGDGAVSFIDTDRDLEVKRLRGFYTPHFMRFALDGRYGYVANLGAHHLTRVDLQTLEIDGIISLDEFRDASEPSRAADEGGFADAQIDSRGMLFAADRETGRVLVYDTIAGEKGAELVVGDRPWVAFAEHPFANVARRYLVPNFGDGTVSIIDGEKPGVTGVLAGDSEAYGVNFSSLVPERAFVMNRVQKNVSVVDTSSGRVAARIPVGGNTETAATSADGKYVVAAVSSANRVVVIDAATSKVIRTFDDVGSYPWSVMIPLGQNYCH